jgi:hypothetical protein
MATVWFACRCLLHPKLHMTQTKTLKHDNNVINHVNHVVVHAGAILEELLSKVSMLDRM